MDQRIPYTQPIREQFAFDQRDGAPQSLPNYIGRGDNVAAAEWTTQHPAPLRPPQPLFYSSAVGVPQPYYFTPLVNTHLPGQRMYHVPGTLPFNHSQLAFRPPSFTSAAPGGYQQARRIRCTQACNYCHRRKARCVRNVFADGSVRCDNCLRDNVPCEWRKSRRRGPKRREDDELHADSLDTDMQGTDSGNDELKGGSGTQFSAKSTLSIASLLNVTDDNSFDIYANASAEKMAAVSGSEYSDLVEFPDTTTPGSSLPPCRRPPTLQPPPLGNLMEEFMSAKIDMELREAVIAYYTYLYSYFPSLHPSTLLRKVVSGTLCPLLEDSLRASTSVFVSKRLGRKIDTDTLFARLINAISIREDTPTVDEVCAYQLAAIGVSSVRGFVYFDTLKTSVSSLLMQLGWHEMDRYDSPEQQELLKWDEWVERETKRRILWISYKIDSHYAGVAGRPSVFDVSSFSLRLPCSDVEWDDLSLALLLQGPVTSENGSMVHTDKTRYEMVAAAMDALSRSFNEASPYETYVTRVGMMQRNAKTLWIRQMSQVSPSTSHKGTAGLGLLGESPLFKKYDAELREWKLKMIPAESLRDDTLPHETGFFEDIRQRKFLLRVRYFCINIYAVGMGIMLHLSNRPSFFAEAEQQVAPMDSQGMSDAEKETLAITALLLQRFGPTWCQGLVAQDVEPGSWSYCLQCAHDLSDSLRLNSDIPLEHLDMVIPMVIFMSATVLLRQIRMCQHALDTGDTQGLAKKQWMTELNLCLRDVSIQWKAVKELGSIWHVDGILVMLRLMHIDEAIKAAEQLDPASKTSSLFS